MKKSIYILIYVYILSSCANNNPESLDDIIAQNDLNAIRAKKTEISVQQKELEKQIAQLDSVIGLLDSNENLPLVTTLEVQLTRFDHYLELRGDVMTKQNVLIYPEMAGTLIRVYVKEGQKVSKGQRLAQIDDGGMGNQLEQLKSQAALAKTTFERQKRLWDQKIGSEIQFLQAKTNYEAADNAVSQASSQLAKSSIRAPFSGIIDNVILEQGTVVSPGVGTAVFRIVNLSNMYIEVDVPESHLAGIQKGSEALVYFPVLGDSVKTKVRQTGNFINPNNRSFTVEIPVPNTKGTIKPNLNAKVSLNDYTKEDAILIPQGIISENAEGQQYVYIATDQIEDRATVNKRIITTGKSQAGLVEVLTGIESGDILIKEGARTVKDGQNVQFLNSLDNE